MEVIERLKAPTPKFWKKVRNACIALASITGIILAAPIALPTALITTLTYAGAIATAGIGFSQLTREDGSIDLSNMTYQQLMDIRYALIGKGNEINAHEEKLLREIVDKIRDYDKNY